MRYRFRKLLIFFYFHYGVWMEKHLSTERLVPRPAAGPGRVARLGRGPLSWCVHSNDVAGYHQHRPGTIMGSHTQNWLEILYGMVMMVHALYLFCVVINGRAFIWMWTIVSAHESSWSISWPPAPAAQCKADILDPGAGSHSSAAPSSLTRGGSGLCSSGGTFRIWSETFSILFKFSISYYRCFCAFANRFLEHKRLYSSPSHLYRQKLSSGFASILLNCRQGDTYK